MHIEELVEENLPHHYNGKPVLDVSTDVISPSSTKRILVGAGARVLFYPTLLYNVFRNKIEPEFRWWDEVDKFVLLGAVPFPKDVPRLKQLGVHGVVTLNEPYETLVPTSLYQDHGIDHLLIPTRDYLFAPSLLDICRAVDFIHKNASCRKTTYVHCKAGRGRSTTIVLCYLVQHKGMTPREAYEYVRSSRPRVLLAACQWEAVQEYYNMIVVGKRNHCSHPRIAAANSLQIVPKIPTSRAVMVDDGSLVMVTESDLDGYVDGRGGASGIIGNDMCTDVGFVCRVQFAGQAALARLSCMWLRSHSGAKLSSGKVRLSPTTSIKGMEAGCSGGGSEQLGGVGVNISVYFPCQQPLSSK
ncbi:phosphatidylglycerophosphate phosphatase PTPMT1-like [Nymphaea colorata]|nr:phosphatidylglycerophosphate phosphatase PTPMT1-like [Nymphaea colorata]XP_031502139.1 phosphatidylglycerophosphate phosphatase PTPMT1-like [Nymphaea colorata]XP_031502140.1 phosphatidylglycerophosphate phosphatase PTPMT1-like [Nymphaea colorata]XP_031502141.1 phosphatidylglycerophosphate phosphatase PTPMT1-like [Nymphaea colorata]XP_031502143.1 phosphatidylglycerophosphate phosphatase PTPMT1-like [Nymphaea colorata]XP_031502144.1 phosphatidylglycerophosphate phosphatase PTPMT1-like [Nympha